MRFKLHLRVDSRQNLLPLNYQYEAASWIYQTMFSIDSQFTHWLHEKGYGEFMLTRCAN